MKRNSYAKVNLTLDVLGKRPDGYHELETVMMSVDIYDELEFTFGGDSISLEAEPPLPENSTAMKAARLYKERTSCGGFDICIRRNIPDMAGLGGSSADAAGVLAALQEHFGLMDEEELLSLALELGSDVPFMLKGGCALCRGRGEIMTPMPMPKLWLIIAKPNEGISTKALFESLEPPYAVPQSSHMAIALNTDDMNSICAALSNGLQERACTMLPKVRELVAKMYEAGAEGAVMTGSGSAVFGIFTDEESARAGLSYFEGEAFARLCSTCCL